MKRIVSCLFAVMLLLTSCLSVYAVEGESGVEKITEASAAFDQTESADQEMEIPEIDVEIANMREDAKSGSGQVDVSILSALLLKRDVQFEVSLTGQSTKTVTLAGNTDQTEQEGVSFENLEPGTYTLTVSALGFAEYKQEITVENQAYFVKLMTGFVGGYDYDGSVHPGVLLIGDVDGNGSVDDGDKTLLVDAIDSGSDNEAADLNGDGEINLVDLEKLAKGYDKKAPASTIEVGVPANAVEVKNDSATAVTGDLSALLTNERGAVTLAPANGGEITSENPVSLEFDFSEDNAHLLDGIVIETGRENPVDNMTVEIVYQDLDGTIQTVTAPFAEGIDFLLANENIRTMQDESGTISIDLKSQVAVKKITFRIMGMKNDAALAEISKVQFLNGMENRIPEPALDIPQNVSVDAGNKKFALTWDACLNVTGYEVLISYDGKEELAYTKGNALSVSSFNGGKLTNNTPYSVKVRSVNGTWRSGFSAAQDVVMKADKKPDPPDNLTLTGKYKSIVASWKKMEDTDSYCLYYREKGTESYQKIEGILENNYTISELKDKTSYQIYVTGVNELGESGPSLVGVAKTTDLEPARMPKYKLINAAEEGKVSEHIINAFYVNGSMVDSSLDSEGKSAWGTVDNYPLSHFFLNSWDSGGYNYLGNNGVTYEFDQPYQLQFIALQELAVQSPGYGYVRVKYWDADGNVKEIDRMGIQRKTDEDNRVYYLIKLPEAVTAKKIQFGVSRSVASGTITFSEVYFYHYDSLEDDIMALYEDDLHTVLRSDVTQATIDELRNRINAKDEISGECHPDQAKLERELKTAEDILNATLNAPVQIHSGITTGEVNRGFGGLNAWQPLGITAAAGEEITVYVGHHSKQTGDSTNLQLVATQYHSEAASVSKVVANLKVGRNDITLPKLSTIDAEAGGSLYVQYTGTNANDRYAVRVSGGVEVPILDLYQVTDREERLSRAEAYLSQLQDYVNQIEAMHHEAHKNSNISSVNQYEYEAANCILGASDILSDTMLLSLPAQQILSGSKGSAETLVNSIDAIENMMYLFYQHKGLNNAATDVKDRIPAQHQNIRYQRMFAGAFMYASGNHIGIEWGSTPALVCGKTVESDAQGKHISGQYFGWGIAHEIGHCINQGSYAVAEITNNYFSVLAQSRDNNDSVRFKYENVYDKVTSGTKGAASNVFTQLGMYWQLHLAYDDGYNYKTYENYEEQLAHLFFARVDAYARTPSKAPDTEIPLTLSGDSDQILMRLSCAAAEKNILEFFERWGKTPNQDTIDYASQFEKETRAIYYANDNSRVYRLENAAVGSELGVDGAIAAVGDDTTATVNENEANRVDFNLSSTNKDLLGYEIVRCTTSGGKVEKEVVGFTTASAFTDYVTTMNNRVVTYEVTAIDHFLNRSAIKTLEPVKIEHKGNIDKSHWTLSVNHITATSQVESDEEDSDDTCAAVTEAPIISVADNRADTVFTGTIGNNAEILVELNQYQTITGFEYKAGNGTPIQEYGLYVREEDGSWKEASSGILGTSKTIYFGKNGNIAAYHANAVKLAVKAQSGQEISIAELDLLGITGDNVELETTLEGNPAIGILKNDFQYAQGAEDVIPAGSIVFTGVYKGNPAYNVVVLYDQDGRIVAGNGAANHIILADVPDTGNIEDVNAGNWIYWISPDGIDLTKLQKVRAELYRVDDALTNEGQRLVSDSLFVNMPKELPYVTLTQSGNNSN